MPALKIHPVRALRAAAILAAAAIALGGSRSTIEARLDADDPTLDIPDSLRGHSGRLRARIIRPAAAALRPAEPFAALFGEESVRRPAVWVVRDSSSSEPFHFITLLPFDAKDEGRVGAYRVGRWPGEGRLPRSPADRVPAGFIEVTPENRFLRVSTYFALNDFLDHAQPDVWPKPLVLDERLIDKLELIVAELQSAGHRAPGLKILSGFRTPTSTARGERSAHSPKSRHQYGDAADIIVDADGDGRMDDLDGDGRSTDRDALVLLRIVEQVESKHPDLVGGIGFYRSVGGSGPFLHVDTRGTRVRWGTP